MSLFNESVNLLAFISPFPQLSVSLLPMPNLAQSSIFFVDKEQINAYVVHNHALFGSIGWYLSSFIWSFPLSTTEAHQVLMPIHETLVQCACFSICVATQA